MRSKREPLRRCFACGVKRPQAELARLVRDPDGRVELNESGRKAGRGAYLCPSGECWEKGMNRGGLDRALRVTVSAEARARLTAQFMERRGIAAGGETP